MPPKTTVPRDCWLAAPAPAGRHERHDAQDERDRSHHDRPKAPARGFDRRIDGRHALRLELPRELDDQDRVLGGERDHQHQADLRVEIARQAPDDERGDDTHESHRHGKNHSRGSGPAFVLGGEHQKDQRDRQSENEVGLVADELLLIGKPRSSCSPCSTADWRLRPAP